MENYVKGEVKEVEEAHVFSLGDKDVHMRVAAGSKIRNLMGYAMKKIQEPETRQMCWSGSGKAITKTVSCAEIMKRKIKGLHQITKIRNRRVEEYWEPKLEGLERLKVNRDIPAISVLLSKDSLDKEEPGYQAPGSFDEFWKDVIENDKQQSSKKPGSRTVLLEGANNNASRNNNRNDNKKRKFDKGRQNNEKRTDKKPDSVKGPVRSGQKSSKEENKKSMET